MDETTHHVELSAAAVRRLRPAARLGALGEEVAASHLHDDGLIVLARNWRVAVEELRGEFDIVAMDPSGAQLVVCEVKTRRDATWFGGAVAAIGPRKRARIRALTAAFLREATLQVRSVRFDVVAIDIDDDGGWLTHVQDAL